MTHNNPHYTDRTAIAPYNFVPLLEKVLTVEPPTPQDEYAGHSGWFECELETSSPTFTRGMVTEEEYHNKVEAKDKPEFFSLDGKAPMLPGSSLRGLFRLLVEVVSHSRLSQVTDQQLVFRAVDATSHGAAYRKRLMEEVEKNYFVPKVKAGYMRRHQGQWYIHPAQNIGGTTFARIRQDDIPANLKPWPPQDIDGPRPEGAAPLPISKNARLMFIEPGPYQFQNVRGDFLHIKYSKVRRASAEPGSGLQMAALAPSGKMQNKRQEAVIYAPDPHYHAPDPEKKDDPFQWIEVPSKMAQAYRDQLSEEQSALLGITGVLRDYQPVFYLMEDGKLTFFGHTLMMRLPYTQAPGNLANHNVDETHWDMTEALFGCVDKPAFDDKGQSTRIARAGRVFFSDAHWQPGAEADPFEREITPKVLSGPKPTTFQHYLEQPNPDDRLRLHNYDAKGARLRGHKFYWQKGAVKVGQVEETDKEKLKHKSQYTRIRPLKAGQKFTFTIRFDNLSAEELGALAWVLQLAANPAYRLKLGMGKPLGLGAVKVSAKLRLLDRQVRYAGLWQEDSTRWNIGELSASETEALRQEALKSFEAKVLTVCPPVKTLTEAPRIRHLLKLLEWPGPKPELTRYMEIERREEDKLWNKKDKERGKRNEYRERPVLPDPLNAGGPMRGDKAPPPKPLEDVVEEKVEKRPSSSSQPAKTTEPEFAAPSEAAKQLADSTLALLATRAAEREAEEERKRQERAERKKKRR
jgi:CRISPR-associated protein (TIGR03986 family)